MIFTVRPLQIRYYGQPITIESYIEKSATSQPSGSLTKEVCFIRHIGMAHDSKHYLEQIEQMDRKLAKQGEYMRVGALQQYIQVEESQKLQHLLESYNQVKELKPEKLFELPFPMRFENETLEWTQKVAFGKVIKAFLASTPNCSESILNNFAVKQLYWMQIYLPQIFKNKQDMQKLRNVVYIGTIKRHELFFLYFLSLMGCNVCYMNPYEDIVQKYPECATFSVVQREQHLATQNFSVPEYKAVPITVVPVPQIVPSPVREQPPAAPVRTVPRNNEGTRTIQSVQTSASPSHGNSSEEILSYEALARLSEAIVMIRVYDRQGEPFKTGSGVVIHSEGYIITNHHVIEGGSKYEVMFENDTRTYETYQVVKYHPDFDLAVIKVERLCKYLPVRTSKTPLRGQQVVAIGSPLGLFNTISDGIVSANRELKHIAMIQFTAPVSHGSSGGGLLDLYGCVIGMITGGFDEGQNINLAVDSATMWQFANNFIECTK